MASGPLFVTSKGTLVLENLDKEMSPSSTSANATIMAKQKINGIDYTLVAKDTTVRHGARSLQGLKGEASMPLGDGIVGAVSYDFEGRHSAAAVVAKRTLLSSGRPLDLAIRWNEKGNVLTLEATTKLQPNHTVSASVDPRTGAARGSWKADVAVPLPEKLGGRKPVSLSIERNFTKNTTSLSAARTVTGANVTATYALQEGIAVLEVGKAPLSLGIKAKRLPRPAAAGGLAGPPSWGRPSITLSVTRALQFDTPWGSKPAAAPQKKPGLPWTKGGNPLVDGALFKRLSEIDSLWKGSEKVEAPPPPPPVKSWSFLRKRAAA